MNLTQVLIIVFVLFVVTMVTRGIVFLIFKDSSQTPKSITYLGKVLPPAAIAMIVVYALRNTDFTGANHGLPEILGVLITVLLQKYTKKSLISIAGGTISYMLLVQYVF